MPRYSAFIVLDSGHYREVDEIIDAADPRLAAQRLVDADVIPPGEDFPIILIVEERAISLFTCDRLGKVVTPNQKVRQHLDDERDRPRLHLLADETPDAPG